MSRPYSSRRELIVVVKPESGMRATRAGVTSVTGADVSDVGRILSARGATMLPLFGVNEDRLDAAAKTLAAAGRPVPQLSKYYRVEATEAELDDLSTQLRTAPSVHTAYIKPGAEPPLLNDMSPKAAEPPAATPDFSARQGYLEVAPGGIDARYAWTLPGGKGSGVNIVDVEGGWNFAHEDLLANQGGAVGGAPTADPDWVNHGTAVLGVFGGDDNGVGVTGICPDANVCGISVFGPTGSAGAIHAAADRLSPGDILLIELHRPGPRFNFQNRDDQLGYIAVEWWPDDGDAIRYAIGRGVIVVEAAGNGMENLDDAVYDAPQSGFPATWSNPFRRGAQDTGAILVGAGAPPEGTHGTNYGADRSRLNFSNYGSSIDVQGWGREVTSTGYGDLQGGSNQNAWYTNTFSGTSSASPMIVGAVASAQGVMRARGSPLTPACARSLLRSTGSAQQDGPNGPASQRIGNRPDLRQMLGPATASVPVPLYRYWNPQVGEHFYTTNWDELGNGKFGWVFESIQCYVDSTQVPGTVPLYRYWNSQTADHFYTTDYNELGAGKYGWVFEAAICFVHTQQDAGTVPLYRYWNSNGADHFYTTNFAELGNGKFGWVFEMVQCYVHAQPIASQAVAPTAPPAPPPPTFQMPTQPAGAAAPASSTPPSFRVTGRPVHLAAPESFAVHR